MTTTVKTKSSEEDFIANFLDTVGITYLREYKIDDLKNDTKSFRVADFYLPKFGIIVEYFGLYNSTKDIRMEYDVKRKVYFENNKPIVIIYPHELGILEYAFHVKMIRLMKIKKFKLNQQLWKYKLTRWWQKASFDVFLLFTLTYISYYLIFTNTGLTEQFIESLFVFISGSFLLLVYFIGSGIWYYLIEEK